MKTKTSLMARIGALIAEYRVRKKIGSDALAQKIKVSASIIHQYERGVKLPSLSTMILLKKELGIPAKKIL